MLLRFIGLFATNIHRSIMIIRLYPPRSNYHFLLTEFYSQFTGATTGLHCHTMSMWLPTKLLFVSSSISFHALVSDQWVMQDTLTVSVGKKWVGDSSSASLCTKAKKSNQAITRHLMGRAVYRPSAACRTGVMVY